MEVERRFEESGMYEKGWEIEENQQRDDKEQEALNEPFGARRARSGASRRRPPGAKRRKSFCSVYLRKPPQQPRDLLQYSRSASSAGIDPARLNATDSRLLCSA